MLAQFLTLAASSPSRRRALRSMTLAHISAILVLIIVLIASGEFRASLPVGNLLIVAGIVEGALLIGWRLTQVPKSQSLEFILVSPLESTRFLLFEAIICVGRLVLVNLAGLPLLTFLIACGMLPVSDLVALLALPLAWGLATGFGLVAWAYEPVEVRRWGERVVVAGIIVYLIVGVLAGENLPQWLGIFPPGLAAWIMKCLLALHEYNPFGVMCHTMLAGLDESWGRVLFATILGLVVAGAALGRSMQRLLPHFHDLHYRPVTLNRHQARPAVGAWPLSWWAVKRVSNYSGRINLWLAGGFTLAYSAYLLAGPAWPPWLGRQVFVMFESLGGVPMLTTALVLLASVPAAFQYGLWDQDAHDRSRRLELLLLTELDGRAYWEAAFAAAWRRGRGYFVLAGILWGTAAVTGLYSPAEALLALSAGVVLWGLHFALGFWAFSSGIHANHLGLLLTLVVPIVTWLAYRLGGADAASWLPPGSIYFARLPSAWTTVGIVAAGACALLTARLSLAHCEPSLRRWYDRHHGDRSLD